MFEHYRECFVEFWKIILAFNSETVNFMYSSGLGYCIVRVAGRLLEDYEKKKKKEKEGTGDQY